MRRQQTEGEGKQGSQTGQDKRKEVMPNTSVRTARRQLLILKVCRSIMMLDTQKSLLRKTSLLIVMLVLLLILPNLVLVLEAASRSEVNYKK
jgi:hypothetical protein